MSVTILKENGKLSIRYVIDTNHFIGFADNPDEFLAHHKGIHEIVEDRENNICWFLIKDGELQYKLNKIEPREEIVPKLNPDIPIQVWTPQQMTHPNISSQIDIWMRSNAFERSSNFSSFVKYICINGQMEPIRISTYLDCFGMTRIQIVDRFGNFL